MVVGAAVMAGWFLDIPALQSIRPGWVTMKFSTALCFFLSGVSLLVIAQELEGRTMLGTLVLPTTTLLLMLFMVTLLGSVLVGIHTGIEDLFVREQEGALLSTVPGRPSVGTMASFILIALAGVLTMLELSRLRRHLTLLGWMVLVVGLIALIGYGVRQPLLFYTIEGWSTAMAFHTACLFVFLGAALVLLGRDNGN
jgi:hypothetical protein